MKKFLPPKLIIICLMIGMTNPSTLFSQTTPLTFTNIPYSNADLIAPGRGAEQWHYDTVNNVNLPLEEDVLERRLDVYHRFQWQEFESSLGVYTWAKFDSAINNAIRAGQKFSFGIMTVYSDPPENNRVEFDGGYASYPEYLHDSMQTEMVKDWKTNGHGDTTANGEFMWVPNWNSPHYLSRLLALHTALNTHINNTSFTYNGKTVAYKNVIGYVDIRGYGNYGEWHEGDIIEDTTQHPAGTRATKATQKAIIDAHINGFPNFPLVAMIATFDAYWLQNTMNHPETAYYILTASNNWGKIGWRRDSYGASDSYLSSYLENNTRTDPDELMRFDTVIMKRFKYAPIVGEPIYGGNYLLLPAQIKLYHNTSFGNGNYGVTLTSQIKDSVRAASKAAGYRVILDSGRVTTNFIPGSNFAVTLYWKNIGLAPTYEYWRAVYELKNSSGTVVWSGNSSFQLKHFWLDSLNTNYGNTDNFTLPSNIPGGDYCLNLIIKDTSGYRPPFPLAITGRNADGSYTLRCSITISDSGSCTNPTALLANTPACNGGSFNLTLASATGISPYDLVINGVTYNDRGVGNTITSFTPTTQKIWTTNPSVINNEDAAVELGVKFQSSESGYIKGLRFFSSDDVGGTYTGHLWSSTGTLLDSVTFTSVTPLGWQEAMFSKPVHIAANTTYVASYHTTAGYYASVTSGLTSAVTNGSLTALASGASGGNGVYKYGASGFPTSTYNSSNYWADVLFVPDTYTFNLTSVTDSTGCDSTGTLQTLTVTSTQPSAELSNTSTCNGQNFNLTLASATGASPYDLVINGTAYNDKTVSSTILTAPTVQKIWTTNPSVVNNEDSPVELGVKFQSSVSGYIRGVRFFSSDDVGGTYKGNLWSSSGTLLQSKNFASVTPHAWQEIIFDAPVAIAANTTYVASYHTTAGYYASTTSGLSSAVTNGSLTALASGTSGGNGVYTYESSSVFPTSSYNSSNYWADVLFVPDTYTFNLTSVTDNNGCVITGSPLQSLVVESDPCTGGRPANQSPVTQINIPQPKWEYGLKQNYPNPTPGNAKIVYTLPHQTTVNLSVYDMHGRLIKVLVNGVKDRGEHIVNADVSSFAKGIYYYKMNAKDFRATRKLIIQ